MTKSILGACCAIALIAPSAGLPHSGITEAELVRRTQQLFDSVAIGNQAPFKEYFAHDCLFFDEKGRNMNKAALVADITPLPEGYSGTIRVEKVQSHIEDNVAILSYDLDETEVIYGQIEKARYHETDTWMHRNGEWKIVAGQVLRYYEDPAPGTVNTSELNDYVGRYELSAGKTLTVSQDGPKLFLERENRPKVELIPEAGPIFFRKGVEGRTLFRRSSSGSVDALIDRRNNEDVIWRKLPSP